ncbi:MAG: RNA methyltransferase [Pedobacter sp.]|nr:MAG: RNA methyltransferase [Pedobacter sp.]
MLSKSQLKYIQSLGQKKQRDADGIFIAEGPKIVGEWLQAGTAAIKAIYATQAWADASNHTSVETAIISEDELARISQLQTPNQVLAVVKKWEEHPVLNAANAVVLALDTLQDPGNLGTIIRIADWFGINQIVCTPETADIYNPKVVQGTMGSLCRVRVLYTELDKWLADQSGVIYATALNGTDVSKMEKISSGVIVIGNESKGVSDAVFQLVKHKITIPGRGGAESLNAAVATGIVLSHLLG